MLALVGIGLGVVTHLVAPKATAPLWMVFYLTIGAAVTITILIAALRKVTRENALALPAALTAVTDPSDAKHPILLLEPSPLFGSSTLVSVYHQDKVTGFEVLMA